MADNDDDGHTHESLAGVLGALGPGGMAAIRFEDYSRLFGHHPTDDEIEGDRVRKFAKNFGCSHSVDHDTRRVVFTKGS
jgi:hypothetical protein